MTEEAKVVEEKAPRGGGQGLPSVVVVRTLWSSVNGQGCWFAMAQLTPLARFADEKSLQ